MNKSKLLVIISVFLNNLILFSQSDKTNNEKIRVKKENKTLFKLDLSGSQRYDAIRTFSSTTFEAISVTQIYLQNKSLTPWEFVSIDKTDSNDVYLITLIGKPEIKPDTLKLKAIPAIGKNEDLIILKLRPVPDARCILLNYGNRKYEKDFSQHFTASELASVSQVACAIPGEDYSYLNEKLKCSIISFKASYDKGKEIIEIENIGPLFSESLREGIKQLKPGNRLFFENIKVKTESGAVRNLPTMSIRVK